MRQLLLPVVIVVALSLGGAKPPETASTANQAEASNQSQAAAETIANAIKVIRPEQDIGCQDRQDNRDSDLCAQWKAADAAASAARYAWWALIVSIVGTGLLLATFRSQRKTASAELRAYVSVDVAGISDGTHDPDRNLPKGVISGGWAIKNTGQTPAYNLRHWGDIAFIPVGEQHRLVPPRPLGNTHGSTLPKDGHQTKFMHTGHKPTRKEVAAIKKGEMAVFVYGRIEYSDVLKREHFTEYRLHYAGVWPPPANNMLYFSEGGNRAD